MVTDIMKPDYRHFILTRMNVGVHNGHTVVGDKVHPGEWLERRLQIFERYCLPSIEAQTDRDFTWVLSFDGQTPSSFRDRIEGYRNHVENCEILYCNVQACPNDALYLTADEYRRLAELARREKGLRFDTGPMMQQGGWVGPGYPVRVRNYLAEELRRDPVKWLVTTGVDNDDSIATGFVDCLHKRLLRGPCFMNFPLGAVYDERDNALWSKYHHASNTRTLVEKADANRIATILALDQMARTFAPRYQMPRWHPTFQLPGDVMWVIVRHELNITKSIFRGRALPTEKLRDHAHFLPLVRERDGN